jgi:hypothetical protein
MKKINCIWIWLAGVLCCVFAVCVLLPSTATRVQVINVTSDSTLTVRSCAGTSCAPIGARLNGRFGTVVGGGTLSDIVNGYTWYKIKWDNSEITGWSAGAFLHVFNEMPSKRSSAYSEFFFVMTDKSLWLFLIQISAGLLLLSRLPFFSKWSLPSFR